jgi:hypothetical protein
MTDIGLDKVSIVAVWETMQMWMHHEKRDNIKDLQAWFNKLYETSLSNMDLDVHAAGLLAFPCQAFDHAVGFARVTKYLAYHHRGTIKNRRPKGIKIDTLQLAPDDFLGPMNHARGGLKSTVHRHMWKKANNILRFDTSKCSCWDENIGQYLGVYRQFQCCGSIYANNHDTAALVKIDAFTIEDALQRSSFQEILDRMRHFSFEYNPACPRCRSIDWNYVVQITRQATQGYFDGLCLDCMDRSKPKGKDLDGGSMQAP